MEDEPVEKPRRSRGTPAYKFSFKYATLFVIGCFGAHALIWHFFLRDRTYRKIAAGFYDPSDYMKSRRLVMSNFTPMPNPRDAIARMWEDHTSGMHYDADSPMEADLK